MKRYIYLLFILFLLNCDNERIVQLPEIENAKITEVKDVSPAYIFYDETQPDSTLFNRKNLIGTTNWLVNVDKRLTLKQAIPHIQYLQDKRKKASMHKNEDAKNYFTCNDTSMGSLGFVEFTDVNYIFSKNNIDLKTNLKINDLKQIQRTPKDSINFFERLSGIHYVDADLKFGFENDAYIIFEAPYVLNVSIKKSIFFDYLNSRMENPILGNTFKFKLHFSSSVSFKEYISIKSYLNKLDNKMYIIESDEFIY
ncbi:hypothetical protein [Winogradskyella sp.]|uniref:hypothetical protein n=1 Tax=Winogradskyella sp. TaxID=1883156 RepID=UPI001B1745FA|nr:hypothetical protein [Winogradskyella sp.]MBO6880616.1 hypothetical protein [Winogradskyella sp.]